MIVCLAHYGNMFLLWFMTAIWSITPHGGEISHYVLCWYIYHDSS